MNKLFKRICTLAAGIAMAIGVGVAIGSGEKGSVRAEAAYSSGTFKKYSGTLTEGYYVFTYNTYTLHNTIANSRFTNGASITSGAASLTNPSTADVWYVAPSATIGYWTLYNEAVSKYAGSTNSNNQGALSTTEASDLYRWSCTSTAQSTTYDFYNKGKSRYLRNNTTYGWGAYASTTGGALTLYKLVTLSSISVSTAPNKVTYTAGEYFDPTGLVITRTYSDSSSDTYTYANHTSEFSFTPNTSTALATNNTSVTISYGGKTTSQSITVNSSGTPSIDLNTPSIDSFTGAPFSITATFAYLTSDFAWGTPTATDQQGTGSISGEVTNTTGTPTDGTSTYSGTLTGAGSVTLSTSGGGVQNPPSVSFTITQTTLSLNTNALSITQGESSTLTATHNASSVGGVNWSTSNPAVATVDGGVVSVPSGATVGATATITVTSAVDTSVSATCTVTVLKAPYTFTWDLSSASYDNDPTEELISWSNSFAVMKNEKGSGSTSVTNYIPPANKSTRFYTNHTLTISPRTNVSISKVEFTATTTGYANTLNNSAWTNATASVNDTIVTVTPTDITSEFSALIGNTCGFTSVKVYYNISTPTVVITSNIPYLLYAGCTNTVEATVIGVDNQPSLTFSSDYPGIISVNPSTGAITAEAKGTATITVSASQIGTDTITIEVLSNHSGTTQNDCLTAEEAINYFNNDLTGSYYVGGTISTVDTTYQSTDYYIDSDSFDFYGPTAGEGVNLNNLLVGVYAVAYGTVCSWEGGGNGMKNPVIVSIAEPTIESISISGSMSPTTYLNNVQSWDVSSYTVTATLSNGGSTDVTSRVSWSFNYASPASIVIPSGDSSVQVQLTVTATLDELSDDTTETVTINRNNLTSLSITNQQTEFSVGSHFSLGTSGVLRANHTSGSPTITLDNPNVVVKLGGNVINVSTFTFSIEDSGKKIDIQYTEAGITVSLSDSSKDYAITVTAVFIASKTMESYGWENAQEVTEFNLDNNVSVEAITDGSTQPKYYDSGTNWRLYQNGGGDNTTYMSISLPQYGYKLKSVSFTFTASGKGMLVFDSDTSTALVSGTEYDVSGETSVYLLIANTETGTASGSGQIRISAMTVKYEYDDLGEWCNTFITTETCNNGATPPSVQNWNDCMESFADLELSSTYLTYLTNKQANQYGNIVEQALARYDEIISKYNTSSTEPYTDLLERIESGKITLRGRLNLFSFIGSNNSNSIAIIMVVSVISGLAVGGYFFLRKRKED